MWLALVLRTKTAKMSHSLETPPSFMKEEKKCDFLKKEYIYIYCSCPFLAKIKASVALWLSLNLTTIPLIIDYKYTKAFFCSASLHLTHEKC